MDPITRTRARARWLPPRGAVPHAGARILTERRAGRSAYLGRGMWRRRTLPLRHPFQRRELTTFAPVL
jgi:hypothetical protein